MSNFHATTLVLDDRGILVTGHSGTGKSTLAVTLIDRARGAGKFAALVSDDQTLLSAHHGRLIAEPPETIAGKMEVCGLGIQPVPYIKEAVIHLNIDLRPQEKVERMPKEHRAEIAGLSIPRLGLPARQSGLACMIIWQYLFSWRSSSFP